MNEPIEPLGRCPDCGTSLSQIDLLIEYETSDGRLGRFLDCPECNDVVKLLGEADAEE